MSKYAQLQTELALKEREMETVEQTYRFKMDQIEAKFDEHLRQMKNKYELDVHRVKLELGDNYKQALNKAKRDIDQIQAHVLKLKKSNADADKVIESYKLEMAKMKESHLAELTGLKMNGEREKQSLKESVDEARKRCELLEQQLAQNEEYLSKQCELARAEVKSYYSGELARVNSKMKDMMRSHADAIEALKRQHRGANARSLACQTEATSKDIDLLEAFKAKYLDTLSRMKSDMMKEYEAQTVRVSERVSRQLSEERASLRERVHALLMPKLADMLREYKVNEAIIRLKMKDLENELSQIVKGNEAESSNGKRPGSSLSVSSSLTSTNPWVINEFTLKNCV